MRPHSDDRAPAQVIAADVAADHESTSTGGDARADGGGAVRGISSSAVEFVAVLVLSITTILTAWSAFESSKWGGAMSIAFSQASSSRIEAARLDGAGNVRISNHIGLWTEWAAATAAGDAELADFFVERFPEPLASAHRDWLAAGGLTAGAPESPFEMPSYVLPEKADARAADERADERFGAALANNQRSDNYTILTVLFAAVLFFTAMSGRMKRIRSQLALLGTGTSLGLVGVVFLAAFPKLV
ncbi:hypothetical protein ACI78T_14410 [Blastococcus sp. SYSU D00922]